MMTTIDELEGRELDIAIVEAIGNEFGGYRIAYYETEGISYPCVGGFERFVPSRNIAQAMELDGEGWLWEFAERASYLMVAVKSDNRDSVYFKRYTGVDWADFPTKAQAYATARCRAFLKAKAATR